MEEKRLTPIRAIRAKCLDCSCGSANEVKLCPVTSCPLFQYRLGRNPQRNKREYTDEQKQEMAERLKINLEKWRKDQRSADK